MSQAKGSRLGARSLFVAAAGVVVLAGLKAAQTLIIPFLLALFLAIICAPISAWLTRRRVPVGIAVLIVVIAVLAIFSGFGAILGTSVDNFAAFASQYQPKFDGLVQSASTWLEAHDVDAETLDVLNMLQPGKLMNMLGGALKNLASVFSNFFLITLTMIFMLLEAATLPVKLRAAMGDRAFDVENLRHIVTQVQRYLGIKTLTSMVTGLLAGVWTAAIGLEFAVVWGLLAFLLNYIPSIGSIVAAVPAVLLGLVLGGVGYALLVALGYLILNLSIGNFAEPYFMGKTLGMSTLVVFLSLVFWGWMWGSIGMLLSVPLTMIIKILLENTDDLRWVSVMLDSRRAIEKRLEAATVESD